MNSNSNTSFQPPAREYSNGTTCNQYTTSSVKPLSTLCRHCNIDYEEIYNDGSVAIGFCDKCGHFTGWRKKWVPQGQADLLKRKVADRFFLEFLQPYGWFINSDSDNTSNTGGEHE